MSEMPGASDGFNNSLLSKDVASELELNPYLASSWANSFPPTDTSMIYTATQPRIEYGPTQTVRLRGRRPTGDMGLRMFEGFRLDLLYPQVSCDKFNQANGIAKSPKVLGDEEIINTNDGVCYPTRIASLAILSAATLCSDCPFNQECEESVKVPPKPDLPISPVDYYGRGFGKLARVYYRYVFVGGIDEHLRNFDKKKQ